MEKLDNLQTQIGYPDWYKDNAAVIRYYDGVFILTQLYNQKMHDICLYKPEILLFAASNRNGLFSKYFKLWKERVVKKSDRIQAECHER